jgi:ankyrin repeat protein
MEDWFERERLHRAAAAGDLPVVQDLVGNHCPLDAFDELGMTPLHHAVLGEHFAVVEYLLRQGADINAHDERLIGDTPLAEAVPTCSLRMARILVEMGADPTIPGWMQRNALDRAKRRRHAEGTGSVGQAVYEFLREATRKKRRR